MHLDAHLDIDVVALEQDDHVQIMLELEAPTPELDPTAGPRPEHTAVVVLDRSGSMSGGRLEHAKRGLETVVGRLDDRDRFGLVVFDDSAEVVVPAGPVGDLGRAEIVRRIRAVETGGSTDLSAGYFRGLQEARRVCTRAGATVVVISDGHANSGITDAQALRQVAAKAGAQAISTSTIGVGTGYDDEILVALALGGNGNQAFAIDGDAAAYALAQEVDGLLSKTVQAASLVIRPSGDVHTVELLNDVQAQHVEGGVMVELGDFYAGENRRLLLRLGVPAMAALGLTEVAEMTLTYVALPGLTQHTATLPVHVNVVPADIAAGRVRDPKVVQEVLFASVQKDKAESLSALRRGDVSSARTHLQKGLAKASSADRSPELEQERDWIAKTLDDLDDDVDYMMKRTSSSLSRTRKGSRAPQFGGEIASRDSRTADGVGDVDTDETA